jgi:hypothetical protein
VLAGILFQLATMTIFSALAMDFIVRVVTRRPYKRSLGIKGWVHPLPASSGHVNGTGTGTSSPAQVPVSELSGRHSTTQVPEDGVLPTGSTEKSRSGTPIAAAAGAAATDPETLRKAQYLLIGVAFASIMIYVRGVYRAIELAEGWTGYLITHEVYFIWLDGFPMVLCLWVFAALHPGWLLKGNRGWGSDAATTTGVAV